MNGEWWWISERPDEAIETAQLLIKDNAVVREWLEERIDNAFTYMGGTIVADSERVDFMRMIIDGHV